MSIYLAYKATVWFKIPIKSEESLDSIIKKIEQGIHPSELYDDSDIDSDIGECELLYDSEEILTPEQNSGQPTIEVVEYGAIDPQTKIVWTKQIWSNAKQEY
jgi:hypothetical protein